jgi:death on curing protein
LTTYLDLNDLTDLAIAVLALDGHTLLVRDPGLLESALVRPQATVFGDEAYPGLPRKAAALMESLARNHALVDGNKRLAWGAAKLFLLHNGVHLQAPSVEQGEAFVVAVAAGQTEIDEMTATITLWSSPLDTTA